MIVGSLNDINSYAALLGQDVWRNAFKELEGLNAQTPLGVKSLGVDGFYVDVHSYDTKAEFDCAWESHKSVIDLHPSVA